MLSIQLIERSIFMKNTRTPLLHASWQVKPALSSRLPVLLMTALLASCGGGGSSSSPGSDTGAAVVASSTVPTVPTVPATPTVPSVPAAPTVPTTPTAPSVPAAPAVPTTPSVTPVTTPSISKVDATKLPVGDGRFTRTTPAVGMVYACYTATGRGGAQVKGPWFNTDGTTWNATSKISVQGIVNWASSFMVTLGSTLGITGNGLPSSPTGKFPVASTDPAYAYDRNPNTIVAANIAWGLPANPTVAAAPTCTGLGAIGVLLNGARLYNADDGANRDAVAWEVQDACEGHPEASGKYHHHNISSCLSQKNVANQHSPLVGYIADGFGIYGNQGENGVPMINADLDECHGHTHAIMVNGVSVVQYHYHQTQEFPYTVGCFKGKPAVIN